MMLPRNVTAAVELRDFFAAAVLSHTVEVFGVQVDNERRARVRKAIAEQCYEMADAMLAARDTKPIDLTPAPPGVVLAPYFQPTEPGNADGETD